MSPAEPIVSISEVTKDYHLGKVVVPALRGVDLQIRRNEYVAVMGPSGSGKSTLMNLIGCLDTPSAGEYWLNGQKVSDLADDELEDLRDWRHFGEFSAGQTFRNPGISELEEWLQVCSAEPPDHEGAVAITTQHAQSLVLGADRRVEIATGSDAGKG